MHIYFSGIGGTAIGPLALIAHQAGYEVSGSDKQQSSYIDYLKNRGLADIHIGQSKKAIEEIHAKKPIDLLVYSSAISFENASHPELEFARENGIKAVKRDALLNQIIQDNHLKLVAVAGTHGKTTTTAMAVWLFKQLGVPVSYSVGAKISFGDMGHFDPKSQYFVYECDEFDRNFLAFHPYISLITGIDYDHHEVYPSRQDYQDAFRQFMDQSKWNVVWQSDVENNRLGVGDSYIILKDNDTILNKLSIAGEVNRRNAWQVVNTVHELTKEPIEKLIKLIERFPGLSRRFEKIVPGLYSDYAHTIPKIRGCIQMAKELSDNVVIVYEPLTNRRQYYIKNEYRTLFNGVKKLYWVPSYLAREDESMATLSPADLIKSMEYPEIAEPAELNSELKQKIQSHLALGDLVVCLSGGGGGSLDEWLRQNFSQK